MGPSAAPSLGWVPGEAEGSMGFLGAGLYGPLGSCSDLCWSLKVVSSSFGGKKTI